MSLLEKYKEKNNDKEWKKKFSSSGKDNRGKVYEVINTNFRTLNSYINQFKKFSEVLEKDRRDWGVAGHKQEKYKQHVIPLLEAKLIRREKKKEDEFEKKDHPFVYKRTAKGDSYFKFIELQFEKDEKWLVNYLYLLNGVYENHTNHILNRTKEILHSIDLKRSDIDQLFTSIIHEKNIENLLRNKLFYIMSFYADQEFLELYLSSSEKEKEEMYTYILSNRKAKNKKCCISHKTENFGTYSKSMILDEIKIFYYTSILLDFKTPNIDVSLLKFIKKYEEIFKIDEEKIISYLKKENEVIDLILLEFFEIEDFYSELKSVGKIALDKLSPVSFIDTTTKKGKKKAHKLFNKGKIQARTLAEHQCALNEERDCQSHYFTSKKTNENYVEVHHLIPHEFTNRFEYSIEVLPNYVVLCPSCHQLVHKAIDKERGPLLKKLLDKRIHALSLLKLDVEEKEFFEFYGIEKTP